MKRKLLLILLLMGAVLLTSGCTENEMTAGAIAEQIQKKQESINDYSATVHIENVFGGQMQTTEYQFIRKNPNMSKTVMILPEENAGTVNVRNRNLVWRYVPEHDVVQVLDMSGMNDTYPLEDYSDIVGYYLNETKVSIQGSGVYDGRRTYILLSEPVVNETSDDDFLAPVIKAWVDKETWMVLKIEATGKMDKKSDEEYDIVIEYRDFKVNTGINDDEFAIPKDIEVEIVKDYLDLVAQEFTIEEAEDISDYNILVPSYLPEGYEFTRIMVDDETYKGSSILETVIIIYSNGENGIYITENFYTDTNSMPAVSDNQNLDVKSAKINGEDAELFLFSGNSKTLNWDVNNSRISVSVTMDEEELLKMAESME